MLIYALSIFISAFLLFQIQPMLGKFILPWFGGTTSVWTTVVLFFQILLTGGYAYGYWLTGRLSPTRQVKVHVSLLAASLLALGLSAVFWPSPIMPGTGWKPSGLELPVLHIFVLLTISVGLPYFLLSTNSPLMQAWFHRAMPGRSPYRLYALSNAGSLLGLLTYPVLIEPNLALHSQGWIWTAVYLLFTLLAGIAAVRSARHGRLTREAADSLGELNGPSRHLRLVWMLLSGTASLLLLAMTNQLTQDVAVIPFLWVLPLSVYLLTFILTFSGERLYGRRIFLVLMVIALAGFSVGLLNDDASTLFQIAADTLLLFVLCMICNGELYRLRPAPRYLTSFYLMGSAGGALGGIFVGLIAPLIFTGYWELYIGIMMVVLLVISLLRIETRVSLSEQPRQLANRLLFFLVAATAALVLLESLSGWANLPLMERNFYGVISVRERNPGNPQERSFLLVHGQTIHGLQFVDPAKRGQPTAYYTLQGGGGLAIRNHPAYGHGMRVGVLGEGIGTLAAYAVRGDTYRFYEINPDVVKIAEGQGGYFSYLADSQASITSILGDARISLERELAEGRPQNFDVLILDTFSSDSIPVHLLTKEAFAVYLRHLSPDGIIAAHVSNNHLNLAPVLDLVAAAYDLSMIRIESDGDGKLALGSQWVLLARDPVLLAAPAIASQAAPPGPAPRIRLWTDDYSNLFQVLK
jgi:hypothetical protein